MLKSSCLELISDICEENKDQGYDAIYVSDTSSLNNLMNTIYDKWGQRKDKNGDVKEDRMVDHPYILIDLSRAFSGKLHTESHCLGAIETIMTNFTSGKYRGGELKWGANKPVVIIVSNQRPISVRLESDGITRKAKEPPICHMSAHRLVGNVYSIKQDGDDYKLVQDCICDQWALELREWEMSAQKKMIAEIEACTPLTGKQLFEKFVLYRYEFDADLSTEDWVSYRFIFHQFHMIAPKIPQKGPGNLLSKIREWYSDEIAAGALVIKKLRISGSEKKEFKFSLRFNPDAKLGEGL